MFLINLYEFSCFRKRASALLEETEKHREICRQGGGEKGIARHVQLNKKVNTKQTFSSESDVCMCNVYVIIILSKIFLVILLSNDHIFFIT